MLLRHNPYTVLASGIFALILALGVARFSYTPMIPYMQEQTDMGEALAGWLVGRLELSGIPERGIHSDTPTWHRS
jgi:hypothetical protein